MFVDSAAEVLPAAVSLLKRWSDRGLATRFHLRMLRPPIAEVEAAIARENAIGAEAWESGTAAAGIASLRRGAASPPPRAMTMEPDAEGEGLVGPGLAPGATGTATGSS